LKEGGGARIDFAARPAHRRDIVKLDVKMTAGKVVLSERGRAVVKYES